MDARLSDWTSSYAGRNAVATNIVKWNEAPIDGTFTRALSITRTLTDNTSML